MKKQGFTLAEVLITLTIIGVVAVLTLPALMTNTNEQQAKTALGKMTNTVTNAAHMAQTTLMFDFSDITTPSPHGTTDNYTVNETNKTIYNLLANTASINRTVREVDAADNDHSTITSLNRAIDFRDGTSIYFDDSSDTITAALTRNETADDITGFNVVFDINGTKGPNTISNCQGKATTVGSFDGDDDFATAGHGCGEKGNRNIKDRFMMRIRSSYVTPIGAASTWALTNSTSVAAQDLGGTTGGTTGGGNG